MSHEAEIMLEVLRKTADADEKRRRRSLCFKAAGTVAAGILLAVLLAVSKLPAGAEFPARGVVLLPNGAKTGCVLAGVVSFALGSAVTLLCLRKRKKELLGWIGREERGGK